MKEYFKDLPDGSDFFNAPRGDDSLVVLEVEAEGMMQYFAKIKDYAYFVSGNEFEGHSSWKLHKASEALSDLWEAAHAMPYFLVLSKYDSISDLRQNIRLPIFIGEGNTPSLTQLSTVFLDILKIFIISSGVSNSSIYIPETYCFVVITRNFYAVNIKKIKKEY